MHLDVAVHVQTVTYNDKSVGNLINSITQFGTYLSTSSVVFNHNIIFLEDNDLI